MPSPCHHHAIAMPSPCHHHLALQPLPLVPYPHPHPHPHPHPNQELIDKTLLFNIKLVRVDEPDGKGGFKSSVLDKFK